MAEFYKVVLVDDEDEVRGRIHSKINDESGFIIVGTASNGIDALEVIERTNPDVLITDIKMPYMDGFELIRNVQDLYPTVKTAIISGYDEFEYARQAIKLNVFSYMTKPITQDVIDSFLIDLKSKLDKEYEDRQNTDRLQGLYQSFKPLLIEDTIKTTLINEYVTSLELDKLTAYNYHLKDGSYYFVFTEIIYDKDFKTTLVLEKIKVGIRLTINDILNKKYEHNTFIFNNGIVSIIKNIDDANINHILYEIVKTIEKFFNIKVIMGVSNNYHTIYDYPKAYHEALQSVSYSKFLNIGRIINYTDIIDKITLPSNLLDSEIKLIDRNFRFGTEDDVKKVFNDIIKRLTNNQSNLVDYQNLYLNLSTLMINYTTSCNVSLDEFIEVNIYEKLKTFDDINLLFKYIYNLFLDVRNYNLQKKMVRSNVILDNVINYIDINYADPYMSMDAISSEFNISISYLCMLFKRDKQTTFNKYLTNLRIEKAKELLLNTDLKIIEIATLCGYNEVYYFSHIFKQHLKCSPKDYRAAKKVK